MDPEIASLHPQTIGDPNVDNSPPAPPAPEPTPEQQRIAALEAELEAQREREQRYLQALDSLVTRNAAPVAPVDPPAPPAPAIDLNDLPDPVQSPTDFKTKLAETLTGAFTQTAAAQQQLLGQMTRAQVLDNLWNRFRSDPSRADLAKREALLQGAAAVTFNELRARGIDPVAIAAQNPDSLIGAIVTRMQAEIGAPTAGAAPAAPSGARAATVAGGSAPPAPAAPAQPKPPSFIEQHRAARRALGIGY